MEQSKRFRVGRSPTRGLSPLLHRSRLGRGCDIHRRSLRENVLHPGPSVVSKRCLRNRVWLDTSLEDKQGSVRVP